MDARAAGVPVEVACLLLVPSPRRVASSTIDHRFSGVILVYSIDWFRNWICDDDVDIGYDDHNKASPAGKYVLEKAKSFWNNAAVLIFGPFGIPSNMAIYFDELPMQNGDVA